MADQTRRSWFGTMLRGVSILSLAGCGRSEETAPPVAARQDTPQPASPAGSKPAKHFDPRPSRRGQQARGATP